MEPSAANIAVPEIHHIATVVDALSPSMDHLSEVLGLTWASPWTGRIPLAFAGAHHSPRVSFTLSIEGPPHIELIESAFERVWLPTPGWHHVGLWADRFEETLQAMTTAGHTVEVMSLSSDFTYLRSSEGARIELVNGRARADFARWLDGGALE